jgi:prevent-host-death family protein
MRTVGLKTLENKLSEYVRLAASGETVVITNRNRIVAEIVPPRRDSNKFSSAGGPRGVADAADRSGHRAPAPPSDGAL